MSPPGAKTVALPDGRWARLVSLGGLAGGIAGGILAEGARQLARGQRPRLGDLLLTPANARRVTDQLARMRGAGMKLGQLMSMDGGEMLPPALGEILAQLRSDAVAMPMSQVVTVLDAHWGAGWDRHFSQFSFTPMAAASIGQVHLARHRDGRQLAIKVQYPGVRRSIDSDVDNLATLLRLSGLLPPGLDVGPLLLEAKAQLHAEADYRREGDHLRRFRELLTGSADFELPEVVAELSGEAVLAMTCVDGVPIESLVDAPQRERDRLAGLLFGLLLRELFEFGLVQTDPNFANYRYQSATGKIVLLDFGATRSYPQATVGAYRRLVEGAVAADRATMDAAASTLGYFPDGIRDHQRAAVLDLLVLACEPLRLCGEHDFGRSDLAARVRDAGLALGADREVRHTPPADTIFLHRKLGGLYLLAARLKARVNLREIASAVSPRAPEPIAVGKPGR